MRRTKILRIDEEIDNKMKELLSERKKSDFTNAALKAKLTAEEKYLLEEKAIRDVLKAKNLAKQLELAKQTKVPITP